MNIVNIQIKECKNPEEQVIYPVGCGEGSRRTRKQKDVSTQVRDARPALSPYMLSMTQGISKQQGQKPIKDAMSCLLIGFTPPLSPPLKRAIK